MVSGAELTELAPNWSTLNGPKKNVQNTTTMLVHESQIINALEMINIQNPMTLV